jgi:hypothetical protein
MTSWEEVAQSEAVHQPPITPSKCPQCRRLRAEAVAEDISRRAAEAAAERERLANDPEAIVRRMIAERERVLKRINEELTPRRFGRR